MCGHSLPLFLSVVVAVLVLPLLTKYADTTKISYADVDSNNQMLLIMRMMLLAAAVYDDDDVVDNSLLPCNISRAK